MCEVLESSKGKVTLKEVYLLCQAQQKLSRNY